MLLSASKLLSSLKTKQMCNLTINLIMRIVLKIYLAVCTVCTLLSQVVSKMTLIVHGICAWRSFPTTRIYHLLTLTVAGCQNSPTVGMSLPLRISALRQLKLKPILTSAKENSPIFSVAYLQKQPIFMSTMEWDSWVHIKFLQVR